MAARKKTTRKKATKKTAKKAAARKSTTRKSAATKAAGKKSSGKKTAKKAASKTGAKKATARKPGEKVTARKPARAKKGKKARPGAIIVTPSSADSSKLGTKWVCFSCNAKFYDLNRPEPLCPRCGTDQRDKPKATRGGASPPRPERKSRRSRPMAPLLDDEDDAVRYDEEFDLGIRGEESSEAAAPDSDDDLFNDPEIDEADEVDED